MLPTSLPAMDPTSHRIGSTVGSISVVLPLRTTRLRVSARRSRKGFKRSTETRDRLHRDLCFVFARSQGKPAVFKLRPKKGECIFRHFSRFPIPAFEDTQAAKLVVPLGKMSPPYLAREIASPKKCFTLLRTSQLMHP